MGETPDSVLRLDPDTVEWCAKLNELRAQTIRELGEPPSADSALDCAAKAMREAAAKASGGSTNGR